MWEEPLGEGMTVLCVLSTLVQEESEEFCPSTSGLRGLGGTMVPGYPGVTDLGRA